MQTRCYYKKFKHFHNYGGRGIKCLWKTFEEFRDDMHASYVEHVKEFGERGTTLDRTDNNGNYCKDNCRWATQKQQARNKRTTLLLTYKGQTKPLVDWAEEYNIPYHTLEGRVNAYGWGVEKALRTPSPHIESSKQITYQGQTQGLMDWVRALSLNYDRVKGRLRLGWSVEDSFDKP